MRQTRELDEDGFQELLTDARVGGVEFPAAGWVRLVLENGIEVDLLASTFFEAWAHVPVP